jgi:hypothetical protein
MDCPTCGLANPPGALKCDCGYDFGASKTADFPGWEISLAWRQMVAAFWSISWPAWIGSFVLVILFTRGYSVELLQDKFSVIALGGNLAFFAIQLLRICLPRRKEDDNTGTRLQRQVERLSGLDRNDWIRGPRDLVS